MKISIILDLGFGDAGKGITTDYLASQNPEKNLVIRFSGGHQVGHTVMKGDFIHTFSNLGAGTLRGVPTYYTSYTTMFPSALLEEISHLQKFNPQLYMHPLVMVTTPYDIAYNVAVERKNQHGSCGVGFGATVDRNEKGIVLYAKDLYYSWILEEKLKSINAYYLQKLANQPDILKNYQEELADYNNAAFVYQCQESTSYFKVAHLHQLGRNYEHLIFEGSQGILLDQLHGIFPHVTRSFTTSKNVWAILQDNHINTKDISIYYITRSYQTRHGNGPMSSTEKVSLIHNEHEANVTNEFQGNFRTSQLDPTLLNYALDSDKAYHPSLNLKKHLVVTCLDQLPDFDRKNLLSNLETSFDSAYGSFSPDSKDFQRLDFAG